MTEPAPKPTQGDATRILSEAAQGDESAAARLLPLVYDELRALAGGAMRAERASHTLQPTAIVHEAYLRMIDQTRATFESRAHFMAVAAQTIRRILCDHARARNAQKRGGGWARVTLSGEADSPDKAVDLIELDEALKSLSENDPRKARVVECRFFAQMSVEETARALDVSVSTVEADWRVARAFLRTALDAGAES